MGGEQYQRDNQNNAGQMPPPGRALRCHAVQQLHAREPQDPFATNQLHEDVERDWQTVLEPLPLQD
jgi:hypothetical protein